MNLNDIQPYVIFRTIAGSHAYGTATPESDVDIRGVFRLPNRQMLSLFDSPNQVSDKKSDIQFYELRRYFELAMNANPNILELLWMPEDCIQYENDVWEKLRANRHLFASMKAYHSFIGYAYSQIKRAKGQNKWVNNPKPENPPSKLDVCYIIPLRSKTMMHFWNRGVGGSNFPMRPIPLGESDADLRNYVCAKMEHAPNVYRLYKLPNAKGVFRGESEQLVTESISKVDEFTKLEALLIFNEQEYDRALKDWKDYWNWRKNRNEARYRSQEAGEMDFDSKNISHCMRLLYSGRNIVEHGEPLVRLNGGKSKVVRDIRSGVYDYEEVMDMVEEEVMQLEIAKQQSSLPKSVNAKNLGKLYDELREM